MLQCAATCPQQLSPRLLSTKPTSGRRGPLARVVAAAAPVGLQAPSAAATEQQQRSNIVPAPREMEGAAQRRAALEAEVRAQLDAENSWWVDTAGAPANLVSADSKADFKRLITEAPPTQLIVVDYLKPSCGACRRLYPKLQQVAAANPDALFLKVNVELNAELAELGQGMGVTHLPWFHLFRGGDLVASFSANVTTAEKLKAEIATHKACTVAGCAFP